MAGSLFRVNKIIKVTSHLTRLIAFQYVTKMLEVVSLRSDVNGEYFSLNSLIVFLSWSLDSYLNLKNIATNEPMTRAITTIEQTIEM